MTVHDKQTDFAADVPFAMYDAFTEVPYSGSQAAIVLHASSISADNRVKIAREIGVPATAFVNDVRNNKITVQFFSTVMELPMCGHGTVCLITRLVECGLLPCQGQDWQMAILDLPKGESLVEYRCNDVGRIEVMFDVVPASFVPAELDQAKLAQILRVSVADFSGDKPMEVATADFIHLCLPMRNLAAMKKLNPDFPALASFCRSNGIETVAVFSTEVVNSGMDVHVRDFCPAVGVDESAAAGTTNAALAAYLVRNNFTSVEDSGRRQVQSEQGIEIGRPSKITTNITMKDHKITRILVGGVASRIMEGSLNTMMKTP